MEWDAASFTECVDCLAHGPLSRFKAQGELGG
jgi:hypothetical protein